MSQSSEISTAQLRGPELGPLKTENLIHMLEVCRAESGETAIYSALDRKGQRRDKRAGDLLDGAHTVASYLLKRGLKKSERVVLLLLNDEQFIDCFFGTIMAGGIPVAVSPPTSFGDLDKYLENLDHVVRNSAARFMISFPRIRKVIGRVLADNESLKDLFLVGDIGPEQSSGLVFPELDPDAPAFFQYTSGSTGKPKGVRLSHRALLSNVAGIVQGIDCNPNDVSVSWLPMFHDMGLIGSLFTALYAGAHIITMSPMDFIMNPVSWLQNITRFKATIATAPNFAYHLLASRTDDEDLKGLDLSTLKVALNGAEPVDLSTLEAFESKFSKVGFGKRVSFPVYGMAENCLAATFPQLGGKVQVEILDRDKLERDRWAAPAAKDSTSPFRAVSVGQPIAGQELAIKGPDGQLASENQVGEILVGGPSVMLGYHENPTETSRAIREGWLHTGDLGFIKDGRLFIAGRAKEMIIKRGRNYYPYDIERAAAAVDGVRKGCLVAFSVPGSDSGTEDLVLVAECRADDAPAKEQIKISITAQVLSATGIKPDQIVLLPPRSIPKTSSGKLQRLLTRRRYLEDRLVKKLPQRVLSPVKNLVGSFLGNQRFKKRTR